MTILIDSDVLINHLRKAIMMPPPEEHDELAISAITYAELIEGTHHSSKPEEGVRLIQSLLQMLNCTILPIDKEVAVLFGELSATLRKNGNTLDSFDLLIAATALHHHIPLFTWNVKHFSRVPNLEFFKPKG